MQGRIQDFKKGGHNTVFFRTAASLESRASPKKAESRKSQTGGEPTHFFFFLGFKRGGGANVQKGFKRGGGAQAGCAQTNKSSQIQSKSMAEGEAAFSSNTLFNATSPGYIKDRVIL